MQADYKHLYKVIYTKKLAKTMTEQQTTRGLRLITTVPAETETFLREYFQHYKKRPYTSGRPRTANFYEELRKQFMIDFEQCFQNQHGPYDVGAFLIEYRKLIKEGMR